LEKYDTVNNQRFDSIINELQQKTNWKNEKEFTIDALVSKSLQLMNKSYEFLDNYELIIIPLLLRQVQEDIIWILGLESDVITLSDIYSTEDNKSINSDKVFKKLIKLSGINKEETTDLSDQLKEYKKFLNILNHTNIEMVLHNYLKSHQPINLRTIPSFTMKLIIIFLDGIITTIVNRIYNFNIEPVNKELLYKEINDLPNIFEFTKDLNEEVAIFLAETEHISNYVINLYVKTLRNLGVGEEEIDKITKNFI